MNPSAAAALTGEVIVDYLFDAWPFAFLHVAVLAFLGRSMVRMTRRIAELRAYSDESGKVGVDPGRLTAEARDLIGEAAGQTGMLLTVGMTGILFGLFEAVSRSALVQSDSSGRIGFILVRAAAAAAPVGVVSLVLLIIARFCIAERAGALMKAAGKATDRALERRSSSAGVLEPICRFAASEQPIAIVNEFAQRLETTLSNASLRWNEIDRMSERLVEAVALFHDGTVALSATASRFEHLLEATPRLLANTERVQQLHAKALDQIIGSFHRDVEDVGNAAAKLQHVREAAEALPDELIRQTAAAIPEAFSRVADESSRVWRKLARHVAVDIQSDYGALVASSRHEIEAANRSLHAAAEEMRRLAEGAQASLTEPIRTAIETARQETSAIIGEIADFIEQRYPVIREDMQGFGTELAVIVRTLQSLDQRLNESGTPVRRHKNDRVVTVLEAILSLLTGAIEKPRGAETIWSRLFHRNEAG